MSSPYNDRSADGDLPRYEPTSHPEDQPGYGYESYNAHHAPAGHDGVGGVGNDVATTQYEGKPSATKAWGFGFRAAFQNAKLWILGTFAFFAATTVVSLLVGAIAVATTGGQGSPLASNILNIISGVVGLVVALVAMRLVLRELDGQRARWSHVGKDVRWGAPLGITLLMGLISLLLIGAPVFAVIMNEAQKMNPAVPAEDQVWALLGKALGVILVLLLLSLLLQPLYMLMMWFAADGHGFGESIKRGFSAGKNNYGQLLIFALISAGMGLLILLTFGLAIIVVYPVMYLAQGHIYRQCVGGRVPVEQA